MFISFVRLDGTVAWHGRVSDAGNRTAHDIQDEHGLSVAGESSLSSTSAVMRIECARIGRLGATSMSPVTTIRRDLRPDPGAVPDLPEHHGRRSPRVAAALQRMIPVEVHEVPSGTSGPRLDGAERVEHPRCLDQGRPGNQGRRLSAVEPPRGELQRAGAPPDVLSKSCGRTSSPIPEHPDWIPYRTSYYRETWGFCLSHNQLRAMSDGDYEVCIDSSLEPGHLTYGELLVPGETDEEFLISAHICHPSLCNDNLSGVSISAHLARHCLLEERRRRSYRFLFIPGTIGAITWLARNTEQLERIRGGLTLVCLGDASHLTYKRSFVGNAEIDRAVAHRPGASGEPSEIIDFFPYGYDERQFNSPGFRLPVGSLMRGRHGQFPEYHTSADNLDFVHPAQLAKSYHFLRRLIEILEGNRCYQNLFPYGEPQLGKRGVYREMGDADQSQATGDALGALALRRPAFAPRHRRTVGDRL